MPLERPFSRVHAPQNDEGYDRPDDDFPTDVRIVSLETLIKGINTTAVKCGRTPNIDVVAHHMGMRLVDVFESFRRAEQQDASYVLESVARGKERFRTYLARRTIIKRLREEKETYSLEDFAHEAGISKDAARNYVRNLAGAKELFGFTDSAKHPKQPVQESANIEDKVRTAYANAVIALYRKGIRHFDPEEIAENVHGLRVKITGGAVRTFLELNPGFVEKIIADEERR